MVENSAPKFLRDEETP